MRRWHMVAVAIPGVAIVHVVVVNVGWAYVGATAASGNKQIEY
jgi:hypothetical protein